MSYKEQSVVQIILPPRIWHFPSLGFLHSSKNVNHKDMLKCCWHSYLTVMYDIHKVGLVQARCSQDNDYALWLNITDKHDCYLLQENLATLRTKWGKLGRVLLTNQRKWRYEAFRIDEDLKPFIAYLYTIRNGVYGLVKWFKYAHRISVQ